MLSTQIIRNDKDKPIAVFMDFEEYERLQNLEEEKEKGETPKGSIIVRSQDGSIIVK